MREGRVEERKGVGGERMGKQEGRDGREGLKEREGKGREEEKKSRGRGEEFGPPMFQTDRSHWCHPTAGQK
jgi:hypothetical protein